MKLNFDKNNVLAQKILRIGLAVTVLWFGIIQILNPSDWTGFLPGWVFSQSLIANTTFVYINGIFEIITSVMLIFNQYARFLSFILALHMFLIIIHLGYNDLAVRDFAIMIGFVSLFFMSENKSIFRKK